jgi:hypothetical protein
MNFSRDDFAIFLFDFFMNCMSVAVSAKLFQFHSAGGVTAIFHCSVTRYTIRPFVGVAPTFGAF